MSLRFAVRSLLRARSFALFSILILAFGIGLSTTAFYVLQSVLLRPLDLPEPDQLVQIRPLNKKTGRAGQAVPGLDFRDLSRQSTAFAAMAAYQVGKTTILLGDHAEQIRSAAVSPGWHETLGVLPMTGRPLYRDGLEDTGALISYGFWQGRLGGDASALGRALTLRGKTYTICGVMPARGIFPENTDVWVASIPERDGSTRTAFNWRVIARRKPGVTAQAAQASVQTLAAALERQYPSENDNRTYILTDLREQLVGGYRPMLLMLSGATLIVLFIACLNVTNLMLARAVGRQRELAVRLALGARGRHLFGAILSESVVASLCGGAAGLLLAMWARDLLLPLNPFPLPRLAQAKIDWVVMGACLLLSLLCGMVTGLLPAWQVWRADAQSALAHGSTRGTTGREGLRNGLLVAEVAFSVLLLVGAGLFLRSMWRLQSVDPGFRTENLLVMETDLSGLGRQQTTRMAAFYDEMRQRALQFPGVIAAAWGRDLPTVPNGQNGAVMWEGAADLSSSELERLYASWNISGPDYFATLGIPLRRGRIFDERDTRAAMDVAVVNDAFVKTMLKPGEDPLGKRFRIGLDRFDLITIVGVIGDVRQLAAPAQPELYLPYSQHLDSAQRMYLTVRLKGNAQSIADPLRRQAAELLPQAVIRITDMQTVVAGTIAEPRFRAIALGVFAAIATMLALLGLYAVISYATQARTREIGVRMALGAASKDVLTQFLARGIRLTVWGLLLGLAGAFALRQIIARFLFGTPAVDGPTYMTVVAVLLMGAVAASLGPAWRASRADPAIALREE